MDAATPNPRSEINRPYLDETAGELEGIGNILLDLATIVETEGSVNWRSLFFLGQQTLAISRHVATGFGLDDTAETEAA